MPSISAQHYLPQDHSEDRGADECTNDTIAVNDTMEAADTASMALSSSTMTTLTTTTTTRPTTNPTTATETDNNSAHTTTNTTTKKNKFEMSCLFTKHKTQKRKVWKEGRLVLYPSRAVLYEANPAVGSQDASLDECIISPAQQQQIVNLLETTVETERFLIEIEGLWMSSKQQQQTQPTGMIIPSKSFQKVLKNKFKTPKTSVPPTFQSNKSSHTNGLFRKRQRPLQPGELARRYYADHEAPPPPPQPTKCNDRVGVNPIMNQPHPIAPPPTNNNVNNNINNLQRYGSFSQPTTKRNVSFAPQVSVAVVPSSAPPPAAAAAAASTNQGNSLGFVSNNGYDASEFYGEDDEDNGEVVVAQGTTSNITYPNDRAVASQNPFAASRNDPNPVAFSIQGTAQTTTRTEQTQTIMRNSIVQKDPKQSTSSSTTTTTPPPPPPPPTNHNSKMSNHELLALFGAGNNDICFGASDDTQSSCNTPTQEKKTLSINNNDNNNSDLVSASQQESTIFDNCASDFYLPDCESSSDDDDDNNNN